MADMPTFMNAPSNPWVYQNIMGGEGGDQIAATGWQQRDATNGVYGPMRQDDPWVGQYYTGQVNNKINPAGTVQGISDISYGRNPQGGWEPLYQAGPNQGNMLLQSQLGGQHEAYMPVGTQPAKGSWFDNTGIALLAGGALGGAAAGFAGAGGAGASFGGDAALEASGVGGGVGGGSAGTSGLDLIGNMVNNVPMGQTATQYAQSLGYPTADAWLAAGAGTGAAAGAGFGEAMGGAEPGGPVDPGASTSRPYFASDESAGAGYGGGAQTIKPTTSILDMFSNIFGGTPTGILARAGSALGLPGGVANALGPLYNIGSGIYGMMQGDALKKRADMRAQQADPFGPYRSGYAQQLQGLMSDPSSITSMPGYKAGLQAVERRGAAQGWNGSGNMMTALSDYGGQFYQQAIQNLMGLSGAQFNPASGAQIGMQGDQAGASIGMQGLNRIGYGVTQRDPTSDMMLRLMLNQQPGSTSPINSRTIWN